MIVNLNKLDRAGAFKGSGVFEGYKAVVNLTTMKTAAVVSDQYELVQHEDVALSLIEAIEGLGIKAEAKVLSGGNKLIMDIVFPDAKLYVAQGEEFLGGIRIINSYDTTTGISFTPRLLRLACKNGMVVSTGISQGLSIRHHENRVKEMAGAVEALLKDMINNNHVLKAMVEDCISDSIEWSLLDNIIEGLISTKKHREAIKARLEGTQGTRWDLYNAITNYCTHDEQLKPNIENTLQKKAEKVLHTPLTQLVVVKEE